MSELATEPTAVEPAAAEPAAAEPASARFAAVLFCLGLVAVTLLLFAPMLLIHEYEAEAPPESDVEAAGAAVSVGVLLRALVRRLLRTGSSDVFRTVAGTLFRTSARTLTRRLVRAASRALGGLLAREAVARVSEKSGVSFLEARQSPLVAFTLGFAALALSFWGILQIVGPKEAALVTGQGQLSALTVALLAAVPVLWYGLVAFTAGRWTGVTVNARTALDGLLLQGYFTGAGSFLPMTTDVEYEGEPQQQAWTAGSVLGGMYAAHLLLGALAAASGSFALDFASGMFLIYAFVYVFPIRPLEGHYIWRRSKLAWVGFGVPILASFLLMLPEALTGVL